MMLTSLLLPASSHQYSGETRMADMREPSMRLPRTSPWLALMRMPRERLKPKSQALTANPFPIRLADAITLPLGTRTSRSSEMA